jgi:hypothetical protein
MRSNPTWAASTHACSATNRISSTASPRPPQRGIADIRRKPVRYQSRRRQRVGFLSWISPQISSERGRSTNLLGGGERGSWVECFAQGGDGEARRGWLERPGGGGDPGSPVSSRGESGVRGGWAGSVDRPKPEPVRLNRGRWAGWAKWAKAICLNKFQIQI